MPETASSVENAPAGTPQAGLSEVPLTIHTARGERRFRVEVAATPSQQQIGMMFRTSVRPDRGMLFPFTAPQQAAFWMKNTLIPLDIIFIRTDGSIANIATATPLSLEPVASDGEVGAVLEIGGGQAARMGIRAGDRVDYRL